MPGQLQDRQAEICEPLIAIADLAGGEWPEKAREALVKLCQQEEDASIGVKLLSAIKGIFDETDADKLSTRDMLERLVGIADDAPWAYWFEDALKHSRLDSAASKLARELKRYKIKPEKIRFGSETLKGYWRASFRHAWEHYLPLPEIRATGATNPSFTSEKTVPLSQVQEAIQIPLVKNPNVPPVPLVPLIQDGEPKQVETVIGDEMEVLRL